MPIAAGDDLADRASDGEDGLALQFGGDPEALQKLSRVKAASSYTKSPSLAAARI